MRCFLNVVLEIEGEEQDLIAQAKQILKNAGLPDEAKASLTRDGDRSGGNLLLPRLEGRGGNHLSGKKGLIKDIIATE